MNRALTRNLRGKEMTVWAGLSQAVLLFEQRISARLFQSGGLPWHCKLGLDVWQANVIPQRSASMRVEWEESIRKSLRS
jgi:hypothetical protein